MTAFRTFATASGCRSASVSTRIARSAPSASAVRSVSWDAAGPQDTATTSVATLFSLRRTASSTAISSNGFIDILTFAVSTPEPSGFTRTLTLKSTTRLTGTRTFTGDYGDGVRARNYKPGSSFASLACVTRLRHLLTCRNARALANRPREPLAEVRAPGNPVIDVPAFADAR